MALVEVRGLTKVFRRDTQEIVVFDGMDLAMEPGDFLALMGPSGSGKSTLLNLLAGLDRPTSGSVEVGGRDVAAMKRGRLAEWRATHIGFIFQLYNLIPVLTAVQNVELPLLLTKFGRRERRERALTALKVVGLTDRADHFPRQLSGGQEQRVGIARAIVTDPQLILADEPTGDLDAKSAAEVLDLLQRLNHGIRQDDSHGDARPARRRARGPHTAPGEGRAAGSRRESGMTRAGIVFANLRRRKRRSVLTMLGIAIALFLFVMLRSVLTTLADAGRVGSEQRLVVRNKLGIVFPLPDAYRARLQSMPGVSAVSWCELVRRRVRRAAQFLCAVRHQCRDVPAALSGDRDAGGTEAGVHARADGRDCRARPDRTLRLEAGADDQPDAPPSTIPAATGRSPFARSTTAAAGLSRQCDVLPLQAIWSRVWARVSARWARSCSG